MRICACGCGGETKGGNFLPGHDQKLRKNLEDSVGGLLNLKYLVEISHQFANQQMN
jgi:hypothetical protein